MHCKVLILISVKKNYCQSSFQSFINDPPFCRCCPVCTIVFCWTGLYRDWSAIDSTRTHYVDSLLMKSVLKITFYCNHCSHMPRQQCKLGQRLAWVGITVPTLGQRQDDCTDVGPSLSQPTLLHWLHTLCIRYIFHHSCKCAKMFWVRFKTTYELVNLRALKF